MEKVQVFLALFSEFRGEMAILVQCIFHLIANNRLSRQLNCSKFANSFVNTVSVHILVVDVFCRKGKRWLCWLRRNMSHFLELEIFYELSPRQEEVRSKLFDVTRLCNLDLIPPLRLLLAVLRLNLWIQLIMVVRAEIIDQWVETYQLRLILGVS